MKQEPQSWPTKTVHGSTILYAIAAASSIAGAQIASILATLVWLGGARRGLGARLPLAWPLFAFLATGLIVGAFATDKGSAFREIGGDWIAILFFFVCVNALGPESRSTNRVRLLIGATALSAIYAISQVFTDGIDYRVRGFLGHFNTYAAVIAIVVLLTLAQILFNSNDRRRHTPWLVAAATLMLVALTLTQSRGALLGFLLGAAVLAAFRDKRLLLLVPALGILVVLVAPGNLKARVTGILDLSDITARERAYMWAAGANMLQAHPLLGVGPGGSDALYDTFALEDDPWIHPIPPPHLHSNIVHLAAERGLLGTLPWFFIWVAFGRRTYDIYRRLPPDDPGSRALVIGSVAAVASFLLAGMADYNHGDSEVVLLMYFTMALPFAIEAGLDRGPGADTMAAGSDTEVAIEPGA